MFTKLLREFMRIRTEFQEAMWDVVGGSKIHVPIPIAERDAKYALVALIHGFWGPRLGGPNGILKVSGEGIDEYIGLEDEEMQRLAHWRGPFHSQEFAENEKRLLEISAEVFNLYLSNSRNDLVKEYATRFRAITPPEFLVYYRRLSPHFLDWLTPE